MLPTEVSRKLTKNLKQIQNKIKKSLKHFL